MNFLNFEDEQLKIAGNILLLLHTDKEKTIAFDSDHFREIIYFEPSNMVVAVDRKNNYAIIEDGELVDWLLCDECDNEGTLRNNFWHQECCKEHLYELGFK
jgi:hypothetical protein